MGRGVGFWLPLDGTLPSADRAGILTGARPTGAWTKHRDLSGQGQGYLLSILMLGLKRQVPFQNRSEERDPWEGPQKPVTEKYMRLTSLSIPQVAAHLPGFEHYQGLEAHYLQGWLKVLDPYVPNIPCGWASLVAQLAKNPPAMQETLVQSLG